MTSKIKNECFEEKNNSNSFTIHFSKVISNDLHMRYVLDNVFSVFKSINGILYIIYPNKKKSIIFYNFTNEQIITEIKNAHKDTITNIRYFLDKINKRELFISVSCDDNNLKLWDIRTFQCLLNLEKIYRGISLFSAKCLNYNANNYIITTNTNKNSPIIIFDFKGQKIDEIKDYNERTNVIDSFYDKKLNKTYLITGNKGYAKSYDFKERKLYHKYCDKNDCGNHFSIIINETDNIIKLIESNFEGFIRIWNFHEGHLLTKIKVMNGLIYGICLWSEKYLFVGCVDHSIKIVDLQNKIIYKTLSKHTKEVATIKKIIHPKYGECLLSFGINNIILWNNYNQNNLD